MLSKNLVSSVLTQIPLFVFGILTGVFSTRILGDEGKGVIALFQANSQFFVMLFSLGIQTGIVYFISSKKMSEKIVIEMSAFVFLVSTCSLALFLVCSHFMHFASLFLPLECTSLTYLGCLLLFFMITFFNSIIAGLFQAHSKFVTLNWISISISLLNLVLFGAIFFLVDFTNKSSTERINIVLITLLFSLAVNGILLLIFKEKQSNLRLYLNFKFSEQLKPFLLYNFSVYLGIFINFFNYRLDLWIINAYLSKKDLSYYSLAANIIQIMLYLSVSVAAVLLPNLAAKNHEERIATFAKVFRISFVFYFSICTLAFLISGFVIPFAYGQNFAASVEPFKLLLPGAFLACLTQLFYQFILSNHKNIWNIFANLLGFLISFIGGVLIIPKYGILGASLITSICYFVVFSTCFFFVVKSVGLKKINVFFSIREDAAYLLSLFKFKK